MDEMTTEQLEDAVWAHPDEYRRPVIEAVARQLNRLIPGYAQQNPEEANRYILQVSHGILSGSGATGEDDKVNWFLSKLDEGRAENWPRDEAGNPIPSSDLNWEQKRLFAGYRGPGWDQSEWEKMSAWDQGRKLSPGEYWDYQHRRDLDFLKSMHSADEVSRSGALDAKTNVAASAWAGDESTPQQMAETNAARRKAEALDWWHRGDGKAHHSNGSFDANYPQASLARMEGLYPAGVVDAISNHDHLLGGTFGALETTVPAIQGMAQGEGVIPSIRRALQIRALNSKVDRHSPVLAGGYSDPSERISQVEKMDRLRSSVAPIPEADSQFLQTGKPHSKAFNLAKRGAYNTLDGSVMLSVPFAAIRAFSGAAKAGKGLASAARAAKAAGTAELGGEFAWSLPFEGVEAAGEAAQGTLLSPDYGEHGLIDGKPLNKQQRKATYERLREVQDEASREAAQALNAYRSK